MAIRKKRTVEGGEFERSNELKRLFTELSEKWCRATRLELRDLADRCGVSLQYLSHIGRYGRVPSRPILTLLAFNICADEPASLFRAAGIRDAWPYESGVAIRQKSASDSGLLSINLDMNGFASAIREIVRAEIQPKRVENLLGKRPLRIGVNHAQFFLFEPKKQRYEDGFFPELIRALVLSLHCEVEFVNVAHADFDTQLDQGKIDCYGPIYRTAARIGHGLFSKPFCHVDAALLGRTRKANNLELLPAPKRLSDLRKREYIVAVHRDSMAHHFAASELGIPASRIIPCESSEEAVERIVLASLPRPAHALITDAPFAAKVQADHPTTTELIFSGKDTDAPPFEDTLAVRSDWPALLTVLDESIAYLRNNGGLGRLIERTIPGFRALGIAA